MCKTSVCLLDNKIKKTYAKIRHAEHGTIARNDNFYFFATLNSLGEKAFWARTSF